MEKEAMQKFKLAFMSITAAYMIGGIFMSDSDIELHKMLEIAAVPGFALFLFDEFDNY